MPQRILWFDADDNQVKKENAVRAEIWEITDDNEVVGVTYAAAEDAENQYGLKEVS